MIYCTSADSCSSLDHTRRRSSLSCARSLNLSYMSFIVFTRWPQKWGHSFIARMFKMPCCFVPTYRPTSTSLNRARKSGALREDTVHLFVRLFVCRQKRAHKTQFSQKANDLDIWSLLTTNRKSYMGFLKKTFWNPWIILNDSKPRPVAHSKHPWHTFTFCEIYASGEAYS